MENPPSNTNNWQPPENLGFDEYQELTAKTAGKFATVSEEATNWALGLAGEAGEVADIIKKMVFHGHPTNVEAIKKECGDACWYLVRLLSLFDIKFSDMAKANLVKLAKRYPAGFSSEASINRTD